MEFYVFNSLRYLLGLILAPRATHFMEMKAGYTSMLKSGFCLFVPLLIIDETIAIYLVLFTGAFIAV